ncbi:MAG: cytochrome c maturation protein CcmE [Sphingomonadaceae bacterium]
MKAKHQRLALLTLALAAALAAVLLAMSAMRDQASYFYAPADVARKGVPYDRAVRIGGMVREGSLERAADGVTIRFVVGDDSDAAIPVRYTGIAPDLFREGSGVVAEGRFMRSGLFVAEELLAKHDENYMPPELAPGRDRHQSETIR